MKDIVYDIPNEHPTVRRHTLAVIVDNEFGVLARVIGLFSGRGYNIESLTVAEIEHDDPDALGSMGRSRITVVTSGTETVVNQIKKLLHKMVPVHKVHDLTVEGAHVERELVLLKVVGKGKNRQEALRTADVFRARVVDTSPESFVFELTGESAKLDAFVNFMEPLGLIEVCRTGVAAMSRGKKGV